MSKIFTIALVCLTIIEGIRVAILVYTLGDLRSDSILEKISKSKNLTVKEKYEAEEILYQDDKKYMFTLKDILRRLPRDVMGSLSNSQFCSQTVYTCSGYIEASTVKKLLYFWYKANNSDSYIAIAKTIWNPSEKLHYINLYFYRKLLPEDLDKALEYDIHGTTGDYVVNIIPNDVTLYSSEPQYTLIYGNNSKKVISHIELLEKIKL